MEDYEDIALPFFFCVFSIMGAAIAAALVVFPFSFHYAKIITGIVTKVALVGFFGGFIAIPLIVLVIKFLEDLSLLIRQDGRMIRKK